jgi:hypothetical protein
MSSTYKNMITYNIMIYTENTKTTCDDNYLQ